MNIDANIVMENLTKRISQLEFDLAVKDAQIHLLEKRIADYESKAK